MNFCLPVANLPPSVNTEVFELAESSASIMLRSDSMRNPTNLNSAKALEKAIRKQANKQGITIESAEDFENLMEDFFNESPIPSLRLCNIFPIITAPREELRLLRICLAFSNAVIAIFTSFAWKHSYKIKK